MYPSQNNLFGARVTKHEDFSKVGREERRQSQAECPAELFYPKYQGDFYQG